MNGIKLFGRLTIFVAEPLIDKRKGFACGTSSINSERAGLEVKYDGGHALEIVLHIVEERTANPVAFPAKR